MSTAGSELLIREYAKTAQVAGRRRLPPRLAEEATAAGHGHLQFLAALLAAEVQQREANVEKARIRAARFPELKELSEFNFSLVPLLNPTLVGELAKGAWIDRREVLLTVGPPGTGKTHICIALGLAACRQGRRVRFVPAAELVTELSEAQAEHRLSRLEQQLDRLDLLILDELGFVRFSADEAQLLFILLAHRYTRGALAISSNLEFADWTPIFNDDARLVAALLDRLTHRCHLLEFRAESYRFRQSLAVRSREGESPLARKSHRPKGGPEALAWVP